MAFLRRNSFNCVVTSYSLNFINVEVDDLKHGKWNLTCLYGFPDNERCRESWNLIRNLSNISNYPWCIMGDFNDILSHEDKRGQHDHPNWRIQGFRTLSLRWA